jgi:hypothetical protein
MLFVTVIMVVVTILVEVVVTAIALLAVSDGVVLAMEVVAELKRAVDIDNVDVAGLTVLVSLAVIVKDV